MVLTKLGYVKDRQGSMFAVGFSSESRRSKNVGGLRNGQRVKNLGSRTLRRRVSRPERPASAMRRRLLGLAWSSLGGGGVSAFSRHMCCGP